ncbi:MAG: class I SAM-dependent methyltransferase [Planctomycetes bacterium]|nr:class I SAM-dependent methyltransferase [Planctomycetota bacterium]
MEHHHLHELIELEEQYWWHAAKRSLAAALLRRHFPPPGLLIEGGIGSGRNLLEFRRLGYGVAGLDIMPQAVEHVRTRGVEQVCVHDLTQDWPFAKEAARAVVMLDVLEHTPDPVEVLRHARDSLAPGGGVLITVPAYPWLYSNWDKRLGHYRRYTSRELLRQAEEAGLEVVRVTHWNAFSLAPAIVLRTWDRLRKRDRPAEFPRVSRFANALLRGAAAAERGWLTRFGVPFGLSLVGVFRK